MTQSALPSVHENLVASAARRLAFAAAAVGDAAPEIAEIGELMGRALANGNKILVFGNGGSAACAQHFAAEFTGKLKLDRRPYPAISLTTDTSALTAIANDYGYEHVFSRQVTAFGNPGDIAVGLSTSGTSANVIAAFRAAAAAGVITVGLTGKHNGLGGDYSVSVPLPETARIQEAHDLILHEFAQIAERVATDDLGWDTSACPFPFVLAPDQLPAFRGWIEETAQSLVTTNGCFDLLHEGHVHSVESARAHGDRLVVFVNSDDSVRRLKGEERPYRDIDARIRDLQRLSAVDHVVVMDGDDPRSLLEQVTPAVHVKGADYRDKDLIERAVVEAGGGTIAFVDLIDGVSTTALARKFQR